VGTAHQLSRGTDTATVLPPEEVGNAHPTPDFKVVLPPSKRYFPLVMPEYQRSRQNGGTFFFTIVTFERQPLFATAANVEHLRNAIRTVRNEQPFNILAGVILPDHLHLMWELPQGDHDFSSRIGKLKVNFTKSIHRDVTRSAPTAGSSRRTHRESHVWQRRFWEHTIRDERDFENHLNYLHYNPVKHGLAKCPHAWAASSFDLWVKQGVYDAAWCCSCDGKTAPPPYPNEFDNTRAE
jgi:REP-associated tyrosine transposase